MEGLADEPQFWRSCSSELGEPSHLKAIAGPSCLHLEESPWWRQVLPFWSTAQQEVPGASWAQEESLSYAALALFGQRLFLEEGEWHSKLVQLE